MYALKTSIILLILVVVGCNTTKQSNTLGQDGLERIIAKKLGTQTTKINNTGNTMILAWTKDDTSGTTIIRYGVWLISSGELIYADTAKRGSVKWLNDDSLIVEDYPGIIDGDNTNFKFKIDLRTKIKIPFDDKKNL